MSKKDFWDGYVPEPDKRQQALDKKAENARELGLDYEPARDSGIVTAGGADPRTQRTEQNFCPRCGKRTKDLTHIHTCTPPPQENT